MIPRVAIDLFATLKRIFPFEEQIWAPAITQPEAQSPDLTCWNPEEVLVHVAVSNDRKAFIDKNLAEPSGAVQLVGNVVDAFHRIIKDVTTIHLGWSVVLKMCVTAKRLKMSMRQTNFDVPFRQIGMINRRVGRPEGIKPGIAEPKFRPIVARSLQVAGAQAAGAQVQPWVRIE